MSPGSPPSRNARCHCGSGLRYKDCHGALDEARPDSPGRPPGSATRTTVPAGASLAERVAALISAGRLDDAGKLLDADPAAQRADPSLALLAARLALLRGNPAHAARLCRELLAAAP